MTAWLLDGGYVTVLALHLGALALLSAWGLLRALRQVDRASLAVLAGLVLVSALMAFRLPARPAVYYDEFFYVAIARNMATLGRAEPLLWQGVPPKVQRVQHFQPPYPQGWPFLLSLAVGPAVPPRPGVLEPAPWARAVLVSRLLVAAMPPLLFLALRRRLPLPLASAGALALLAMPLVLRLSSYAGAEGGSLFFMVLSLVALEAFSREPDAPGLAWLVLAATALAEMRPENLLYLPFLLACAARPISSLSRGVQAAALVLAGLLVLPPMAVMLGHDPALAHHFEATPRGGFTIWENRLANLGNNALYLATDRIWPAALSLLALVGLVGGRRPQARLPVLLAASWAVGITLFLSWYPFGDYAAANSVDTWRFGHHVVLPLLILALGGGQELTRWGRGGALASGLLLGATMLSPWTHGAFLEAPHPLAPQEDLVRVLGQELGRGLVVAEAPEYFCYLRYGHGLPAVLAPVATVPEGGLVLFALDEGAGLPDLAAWSRFDLEPLAVEQEVRPPAGIFRVRDPSSR